MTSAAFRIVSRPGSSGFSASWLAPLALLAACGDQGAYEVPEDVRAVPLFDGRTIAEAAIRGTANDFAVSGDRIVFADMFADSTVVVLDTAGTVLQRFGPRGDGPTETRTVNHVEIVRDTVWWWDSELHRISRVPLADLKGEAVQSTRVSVPATGIVSQVYVRGGRVVGTGMSDDGLYHEWLVPDARSYRMVLPNETGRWKGSSSRMVAELPDGERWQASQSVAAVSEDGERLVVGYLDTGELVIVDLVTGRKIAEERLGDWDVEWETVRTGSGSYVRTTEESLIGYISMNEAGPRVVGLFVGKSRAEAALPMSLDAREVHVFDWTGQLEAVYRVDRPLGDVELQGDRLYGLVVEPIPKIVVWELPRRVADQACFPGVESEEICSDLGT